MAFNNYAKMLQELKNNKYCSLYTEDMINNLRGDELDKIVCLYNIYCMPKKFELDNSPASAYRKTKKR